MQIALTQNIPNSVGATIRRPAPKAIPAEFSVAPIVQPSVLLPILTASLSLHLVLTGIFGAHGINPAQVRAKRPVTPVSEVKLIEDIRLEPEPVDEQPASRVQEETLTTPAIPMAANIDLPPLAKVEPISAVAASVPVAFGIAVTGPVRLVSDAAKASGAVSGRRAVPMPVSLDENASEEKYLLLPRIDYPPDAILRQQSGAVIVEFRTTPTGEITEINVRQSSGFAALDKAAVNNLKRGRWSGQSGFYSKTFEFRLN
ncbi:MAG: TonB family protein [Opitutaceae bacterium]|jgi:protein TonB